MAESSRSKHARKVGVDLTRRTALRLLGSSAGIALLAGCGVAPQTTAPTAAAAPTAPPQPVATPTAASIAVSAPNPTAPAPTPAAPVSSASTPRRGGTARYSIQADLSSIDGHVRTPGAVDSLWLAFDHLTLYDQKLQPQPMLAESWDLSPDFKQVKFNLRKGVTYHSGRDFTSDDVKWNLLRVRRP